MLGAIGTGRACQSFPSTQVSMWVRIYTMSNQSIPYLYLVWGSYQACAYTVHGRCFFGVVFVLVLPFHYHVLPRPMKDVENLSKFRCIMGRREYLRFSLVRSSVVSWNNKYCSQRRDVLTMCGILFLRCDVDLVARDGAR
jgi:hypothetical protein